MKALLKSMAIVASLISGLQAMDEKRNELSFFNNLSNVSKLTFTEEKKSHKMLLLKEVIKIMDAEQQDVYRKVGLTFLEVTANPVLDGELAYTHEDITTTFKIKDLVDKDSVVNLSSPIFGDTFKDLVITVDPKKFFSIVKNSAKLIVLIAPRSLIKEKLETTAINFQPIMDEWIEEQAPIGIFWRIEFCNNFNSYLTSNNLSSLSQNSLEENWLISGNHGNPARAVLTIAELEIIRNTQSKLHVHFCEPK
jgi:hypothetical protein